MKSIYLFMQYVVLMCLATACTSYKIPATTANHPACTDADVCQVELSPILDTRDIDAVFD